MSEMSAVVQRADVISIAYAPGATGSAATGDAGVSGEFTLAALTHNLLKLWRGGMAATG